MWKRISKFMWLSFFKVTNMKCFLQSCVWVFSNICTKFPTQEATQCHDRKFLLVSVAGLVTLLKQRLVISKDVCLLLLLLFFRSYMQPIWPLTLKLGLHQSALHSAMLTAIMQRLQGPSPYAFCSNTSLKLSKDYQSA